MCLCVCAYAWRGIERKRGDGLIVFSGGFWCGRKCSFFSSFFLSLSLDFVAVKTLALRCCVEGIPDLIIADI